MTGNLLGGLSAITGRIGGALGGAFAGTGGLVLRFVLSAAIGAGGALGVGAATSSTSAIRSTAQLAPASTFGLEGSNGPADFSVTATSALPITIKPLPETSTIQLITYKQAVQADTIKTGARPPWWNTSVPRVPAITQFDGGQLQGSNCTMASGAMLARLAYGVVATGSQLRALQDNQSPVGTTLGNLEQAMSRGWGVQFFKGALTPLQLRALMFAGAGAVIQGLYGEIPEELRLQKNFLAGHAIYLDGFRPASEGVPAAYYVIDPLGRPANGYVGSWWPADIIEDFGQVFGGGYIPTVWDFAGGIVPKDHPQLPADSYPDQRNQPPPLPQASQSAAPSEAAPSESVTPSESPAASTPTEVSHDPMPTGDVGTAPDLDPGTIQPEAPPAPSVKFEEKGSKLSPLFIHCISRPAPADCPKGILGVVKGGGATPSPSPSASTQTSTGIDLLYANPIGPDTYQIVFKPPPDTTTGLWLWRSDISGGTLIQAITDPAVLNGQEVSIATVFLDPSADYSFVATAAGDNIRVVSTVGSITVGG